MALYDSTLIEALYEDITLTNYYIELARNIVNKSFDSKKDLAGDPYINHLERVATMASNNNLNQEIYLIGLLHDILEDCPEWTEKALRHLFPANVVSAVVTLTKRKDEDYYTYISRVLGDRLARQVKEADLIDNMDLTRLKRPLNKTDIERIEKYHKAYLRIYNSKFEV